MCLTVEGQTPAHLLLMSAHDSDPFNRYEAGQRLCRTALLELYATLMAAQVGVVWCSGGRVSQSKDSTSLDSCLRELADQVGLLRVQTSLP